MTVNCRFHCAACDRHFTSIAAFDLHRVGPHDAVRKCVTPRGRRRADGTKKLLGRDGQCRLTETGVVVKGVIWSGCDRDGVIGTRPLL